MKTHIKLYKVKKKWVTVLVVSGITMSMGLGIGIVNQSTDVSAITIDPVNKKLTQNKSVVQSVPMDTANTQIKNILLANDGTDENWYPSLPTQSGLYGDYSNSYANATIVSQNGKDYSIDYRVGPTTGQGTRYANYTKASYASEREARSAISEEAPSPNDGGTEGSWDLGHGITAQVNEWYDDDGSIDSSVEWGQQDYNIYARTSKNKDNGIYDNYPNDLAKETADKISSEKLPKTEGSYDDGSIVLDAHDTTKPNFLGQKIWIRQGNDVYTLSAHDPKTLLDMAGSLRYI